MPKLGFKFTFSGTKACLSTTILSYFQMSRMAWLVLKCVSLLFTTIQEMFIENNLLSEAVGKWRNYWVDYRWVLDTLPLGVNVDSPSKSMTYPPSSRQALISILAKWKGRETHNLADRGMNLDIVIYYSHD